MSKGQIFDRIVAAEKYQAANSRNTFYFSRLDIFPPSGDPALLTSDKLGSVQ